MTDILDLFAEMLKILEAGIKLEEKAKQTAISKEFEEGITAPAKKLYKELHTILDQHIVQGEQKIMEVKKMANISKVKEMIKNKIEIIGGDDEEEV